MNTERTMITFQKGSVRFTYRVGGIIIHNNRVLFQKADADPERPFWFLPGGRAELRESAEETLQREVLEELGTSVKIERLVFIVENFFYDDSSNHELGLYFLLSFPTDCALYQESGPFTRIDEAGNLMLFEWLPLEHLEQLTIYPQFFRTALTRLPEQIEHILQTE